MEACVSRLSVNIYHSVFRKIFIRPARCLCTKKEDRSQPSEASLNESDAKVNRNLSGDHDHPSSEDESNDSSLNETDRLQKSSLLAEDASHGNGTQNTHENLLSVLSDLKVSRKSTGNIAFNLDLAKPVQRLGKKKDETEVQLRKYKRTGYSKDMASAVKAVASTLGGDVEKTEQELVQSLILMDHGLKTEEAVEESSEPKDAKDESDVSESMMSAVRTIASSVVGDPEKTESELMKKLISLAEGTFKATDMSEVVEGMKVEKKKVEEVDTKMPRVMQTRIHRRIAEHEVNLFSGIPLNIFKLENEDTPEDTPDTSRSPRLMLWDELQKKELQSLVQYAPSNSFEEMIQWTEQGKFWAMPVNNEAGMHEEENVSFHEHIFLDHLLDGFPENRSIRYFMELVIVGLSKNPYISVQRKADHVAWYREYFEKNREVLKQYEDAA